MKYFNKKKKGTFSKLGNVVTSRFSKYFNKETFFKLGNVVTSRFFMMVALVILVLLLLRQCGEARNAKTEALREHNNYIASLDSVRTIKNKLG